MIVVLSQGLGVALSFGGSATKMNSQACPCAKTFARRQNADLNLSLPEKNRSR